MKVKLKLCSGCNLPKAIWKNVGREKFCRECYGKSRTGVAKKPKPTARPIPSRSSKKIKLDILYKIARDKFLADHPMCHAKIDARCQQRSCEVHHKKGKIADLYLDTTFWLPACRPCHVWVENHPEEAIALGLSLPRLATENNNN